MSQDPAVPCQNSAATRRLWAVKVKVTTAAGPTHTHMSRIIARHWQRSLPMDGRMSQYSSRGLAVHIWFSSSVIHCALCLITAVDSSDRAGKEQVGQILSSFPTFPAKFVNQSVTTVQASALYVVLLCEVELVCCICITSSV